MRRAHRVLCLVLLVAALFVPVMLRASEEESPVASMEQRLRAVYETVGPAVVRIVRVKDRELPFGAGVIMTPDGYVVTPSNPTQAMRRGELLAVYLPDGRRVTAAALGWSDAWSVGLMKIAEEGPWPHVPLGKTADVKAGDPCVALGFPSPSPYFVTTHFDRGATLRLGRVTRSVVPIWPTRLSDVSDIIDRGSVVFDLEGRLVGVIGDDGEDINIELAKTHWADLASGQDFDPARLLSLKKAPGKAPGAGGSAQHREEEQEPAAAAIEKAKAATVRIGPSDEGRGWSGVIVSSDGYVATSHRHGRLPGEKVTISLPDGRKATGVVLGTSTNGRVSLVKISGKGSWPHAELGNPQTMGPDDPCLVVGYPAGHRDRQPLVRSTRIGEPIEPHKSKHCVCWLSTVPSCRLNEGDSGDGVFDLEGRLVALYTGWHMPDKRSRHTRVDQFHRLQRGSEGLVPGSRVGPKDLSAFHKPIDVVSFEPLGEVTAAYSQIAGDLLPIVVEVLGDKRRRALGTIVRSDGQILTKASELYGTLSCRLADGRVFPATVEKTWRAHDLAVLRIQADNLPEAKWSRSERISVGTLIVAPLPQKPPLVGVVSLAARPVPPEPGSLGVGVHDSDRGLEVHDDETARDLDVPIRKGDVIVHVEGHRTPDLRTYAELMQPETGTPIAYPGDPIRVGVKRGDETLELRFPLPSTKWIGVFFRPDDESLRSTAFPSAFDTDLKLTPNLCGGPVIDRTGRVAGIVIARRTRGRTLVVPAAVANTVVAELPTARQAPTPVQEGAI